MGTYVLKNLAYDSMRRLDLFKLPCPPDRLAKYIEDIEITTAQPWVCQEFIKGQEYSTCAIAHQGSLTLFTDNKASISCFNYQQAGERKLREWVEKFAATYKLTGILCIDFFIDAEGTPMAIECNPRFSSNITNFSTRRPSHARTSIRRGASATASSSGRHPTTPRRAGSHASSTTPSPSRGAPSSSAPRTSTTPSCQEGCLLRPGRPAPLPRPLLRPPAHPALAQRASRQRVGQD